MQKITHVLLFFFLFLIFATGAHATAINITNIGDTQVSSGYPLRNAGARPGMQVQSCNASVCSTGNQYGFFQFDTSTIPSTSTIISAYLYLYTTGDRPILAYNSSLSNASGAGPWNEGTLNAVNCAGAGCAITSNLTWSTMPAFGALQQNVTVVKDSYNSFNVTLAVIAAVAAGNDTSIILRDTQNDTSAQHTSSFETKESAAGVRPYLTVDFGTPDNCTNPVIGSYCDMDEMANLGVATTVVTSLDYSCANNQRYACPGGTICTQLTPVANVTNGLVTDSVMCQVCWFRSDYNYFNNSWVVYSTNCPNNPECNNCDYPSFPSIGSTGWTPRGALCVGNNLIASDVTGEPADVDEYSAGCVNNAGVVIDVVDWNGNHTNITGLTQQIWNTTEYNYTLTCPTNSTTKCFLDSDHYCAQVPCSGSNCTLTNTTSQCYDWLCNPVACSTDSGTPTSNNSSFVALAIYIAGLFGVQNLTFALSIFSILGALAVGFVAMYYTRNSDMSGQAFIFGTLGMLIMFSLISWFPGFLTICLIIVSAFIVAKKLNIGGG